jgi:hypothetical protein
VVVITSERMVNIKVLKDLFVEIVIEAFSDRVKKFTYKDKEKFLQYYMNNVGIRKSALFMGCSPSLIVRWVKELSDNIKRNLDKAKDTIDEFNNNKNNNNKDSKKDNNKNNNENKIPDIIEMDEIYTRVKKGQIKSQFGLLILDNKIELLHIPLEKE